MGRREKLLDKLLRRPPEAEYADIRLLLEWHGFEVANSDGSHLIFRHPDGRMLTVPTVKRRKVKRAYVTRALQIVGVDDSGDNGE